MKQTILFFLTFFFISNAMSQQYHLFIGTYTGSGSKGIYVYRFDAVTGRATALSHTDSAVSPSFLALSPDGRYLYACNEGTKDDGGGVSAYRFQPATGRLSFINHQWSGGDHPAYVAVDPSGQWVLAGNYTGGSVAAFPVAADGGLRPLRQLLQHSGQGPNAQRQEKAHVHATVFSPAGDHLLVPDLGIDRVLVYRFRPAARQPLQTPAVQAAASGPGNGPRHLTFHPSGKWAYLVEEMAGAVLVFQYKSGRLTELQRILTHPDSLQTDFGAADIHLSPDGRFLYASNRGTANNLAIFRVHQGSGKLTAIGHQSTLGEKPRNFCIDPTGRWLLVANQETNNIVVFKRNRQTGLLQPTASQIKLPKPVCLLMQPAVPKK